jgi:gamma-glutamyl-gamma-aminobutyrate hydrolase PuuD
MKIFSIENGQAWYGSSLSHLGKVITDFKEFSQRPETFDLVLFTGGEDVHPGIYGHRHYSGKDSGGMCQRDMKEAFVFQLAQRFGIPMAGICRGLQFTAAMCGSTLVQDFGGHGWHSGTPILAKYPDGKEATIEGLCMHHQMVDANTLTPEMNVVGYVKSTGNPRRKYYLSDNGRHIHQGMEIEAIFCTYPLMFGVQYHPESMPKESSGYKFFCTWVEYMVQSKESWNKSNTKVVHA